MTTLLVILWLALLVTLVVVMAMRPRPSRHSWFELKRRGDEQALRRERLLGDVYALRRIITTTLIALLSLVALATWQWWSLLVMLFVALLVVPTTRIAFVRRTASRLYDRCEPSILRFVEKWLIVGWFGRYEKFSHYDSKLESVEQLRHLVESAGHILSDDQQRIVRHGLDWHETTVGEIMTRRQDIVSIKHSELLGPLVLDDLHRSGHNRFPVVKGTIDTVIGMIDITHLLEVTASVSSQTAEKAMSPRVLRIESHETLPAALALLQKSHEHMLIVIDEDGKTAGLITLADITGSLLGKTGVK